MSVIQIQVDNRLRFPSGSISEAVKQELRNLFTHKNNKHAKLKTMGFWPGNEPEFIRTFEDSDDGDFSLPRGGTNRVREVLREHQLPFAFRDVSYEGPLVDIPDHKLKLYPYQEEAMNACIARRNCLLQSPTGSGKTTIAIATIAALKRRSIVVVWNSGLAKQWIERLQTELGLKKSQIGTIMGGKVNVQDVTVAMQQTLFKRDLVALGLDRYFGLFIADEVQRWSARTFRESTEPFHSKWRLGVSADYTRHDKQEGLTQDIFGQVAYEIDSASLADQGVIHDVEIRVVETSFDAPWYKYDKDFTRLTNELGDDQIRTGLTVKLAEQCVADGGSVLVFCHRVNHCRKLETALAETIPNELMLGGVDYAARFEQAVKGLRAGTIRVGIGTIQAIGQGIDIPAVNFGIVASPITSNRQQFQQVIGRICRKAQGKSEAVVYYLWDKAVYGLDTLYKLRSWNRRVLVLQGDRWVPCDDYIKEHKIRARGLRPQHVLR
jgi:superfamily II DNA or RNA helicase